MAVLQYFGEEAELPFDENVGGEAFYEGFIQTNAASPPDYVEWDWSQDEVSADGETTELMAVSFDSAPVFRIDPIALNDNYFELNEDNYEDPVVSDAEWASPIQPNAPSLASQYMGDDAELHFADDDLGGQITDTSFQTADASPNATEDPWIWSYDDTDEEWIILNSDYDARFAPPIATAPFQYFGDDAEQLIEDELAQRYDEGYIQADNGTPPPTTPFNGDESYMATMDEEAEDFFTDHFGNIDADQTYYDEQWDYSYDDTADEWIELHCDDFDAVPTAPSTYIHFGHDAELLDEQFDDELVLALDTDIANNGFMQLREESYDFAFDDIEDESFLYDEVLVGNAFGVIPLVEDAYDFSTEDIDNDEWVSLHNDDFDAVGPNAPPTLPPQDAWLFEFDDIEDQWEIEELVGPSFLIPVSAPVEDPWSWDNDDTDEEWIVLDSDDYDSVGLNAPVIVVEDAWDFVNDDIEDQWEIDEVANVDGQPFIADAWDFAFDDIEDQWDLEEPQSVNAAQPVEDAYDLVFDDIEDESFFYNEQTGANAIPKLQYYDVGDAELLDEQFDDEVAQSLDVDPVGGDYQVLVTEDAWDYHEEVEDDWHSWPSESVAPTATPFIDYGDDLLHFFDELYYVDDDCDWFAAPVFVVIPKRTRLTITQVTTLLMVRR